MACTEDLKLKFVTVVSNYEFTACRTPLSMHTYDQQNRGTTVKPQGCSRCGDFKGSIAHLSQSTESQLSRLLIVHEIKPSYKYLDVKNIQFLLFGNILQIQQILVLREKHTHALHVRLYCTLVAAELLSQLKSILVTSI